jgi:hypothetical protein
MIYRYTWHGLAVEGSSGPGADQPSLRPVWMYHTERGPAFLVPRARLPSRRAFLK